MSAIASEMMEMLEGYETRQNIFLHRILSNRINFSLLGTLPSLYLEALVVDVFNGSIRRQKSKASAFQIVSQPKRDMLNMQQPMFDCTDGKSSICNL
eukprot:scaffold13805_cov23-Cyclotella_meneghiniana.AAC.5